MKLKSKKIAIMATNGFEQIELFNPLEVLKNEGAHVEIVSLDKGEIKGWDEDDWGKTIKVNKTLEEAKVSDYDALVLPGGVINPDKLRTEKKALEFVNNFIKANKTVGAICHAPWILISANVVKGKRLTSFHSIKDDMKNAGANWLNQSVVCDSGIVTSRNPNDLPDFTNKLIEEISD